MAQILFRGDIFNKTGCVDPLAQNYDPTATNPCPDCCVYATQVIGCKDPLATNYDSSATVNCDNCCIYYKPIIGTVSGVIPIGVPRTGKVGCAGPYTLSANKEVIGIESAECCTNNNPILGPPPQGYEYYWDGTVCKQIPICPTNITCIDCTNFDWWNDTYISNHNGQSLSVTSPILWQKIVDLVTNSGQTISVNTLNGELISQDCCKTLFKDGICFCQEIVEEKYEPKCIETLGDFLNLISNTVGYNFFINNFSTIGPSLGLTTQQINFIKLNINNTNDGNNNGIQDLTEARLILSNALNITGGFYVNFGTITNTPKLVTKGICEQYGGYWDSVTVTTETGVVGTLPSDVSTGTPRKLITNLTVAGEVPFKPTNTQIRPSTTSDGNCMCKPVVDQCEIDLSQVQVLNSYDFFNNPIQIVSLKEGGSRLNESCCNRLINDNPTLGWVWQAPYCLASPREDCLPAIFELNDGKLMEVPTCENDLELSMWVYFEKPENPCQPIPDPPNDNPVIIEGQACDITLTPNTGAVNNTGGKFDTTSISGVFTPKIESNTTTTAICCYNTNNPILARVSTTDPVLNQFLTQVKEYNSATDYFGTWIQIKATLPTSGLTLNFGLNLEIYQGLNCCCDYDFFVDDIQVNCVKQVPSLVYNNVQCPGFNLTRVIDNKKSWVYNPGIPSVGISDYDNIEREDGSFGMLNGEGTINRTFAPSLDAEMPWRYTDYWQQSSTYEKHSNLVLNSKELWLTFDMCADCPISATTLVCPPNFTLSANTEVCYQEVYQKIFQDGDDFIFMDGDNYIFQ